MKKFKNSKSESSKTAPPKSEPIKVKPLDPKALSPEPVKVVLSEPVAPKEGRIFFEFVRPGAKRVCVAGSFNNWKPENTPLVPKDNGRWVGDLTIQPGRYEYLFVVDGQWLPDPNATESVQNPFGGRNSVLGVSD